MTTDELTTLEDEANTTDEEATTVEEARAELEATSEEEIKDEDKTEEDITDDDTAATELDETAGGGVNTVIILILTPQPGCVITPVELPRVESSGII